MTVSRVINGEANVRPQTRELVNVAIGELRYQPNTAARTLAGAGRIRIGLLYSNPSAGFLSEFLVGSLDQAARSDVQIVVEKCEIGDHEVQVARHLVEQGIDGVVLPPPLCEAASVLAVLAAAGVPAVRVAAGAGEGAGEAGVLATGIDDHAAAAMMTRHIMALGHRRIGFIGGDPTFGASRHRLAGHRAALAEAGIAPDPALIVPGLYTYRSGLDAAEALLGLAEPPTAIFASNDDMAAASVAVAHRRGVSVPGDLTVCGFDDTSLSTAIWPELTTIRQPIADMARTAIEMLVRAARQPPDQRGEDGRRVLDFTLVRRQSDAPPRPPGPQPPQS